MRQDRSQTAAVPPLPVLSSVAVALLGIGLMAFAGLQAGALVGPLGFRGVLIFCEAALVLPAALALFTQRGSRWVAAVGWQRVDGRTLALCGALGLTLWVASLGLLELQYAVWPPAPGYIEGFRRLHEMLRPRGPLDALGSLLAIALMPALCEEAVMRGVLLPSLRLHLAAGLSVILSALLFALMHFDYRMPFTFAVGLALGALRLRTGSLVSSVVTHATLNALTFAAAPFLDDPQDPLPDPRPWLGLGLLVLGASTSAWAYRALANKDH